MTATIPCHHVRRASWHRFRLRFLGRAWNATGRFVAALLFVGLLPLMVTAAIIGARLRRRPYVGAHGRVTLELSLVRSGERRIPILGSAPQLLNIARGQYAWVGPEARVPGELNLRLEEGRRVASVPPGLFCTWRLRKRTNVAYGRQIETDIRYIARRSMKADAGILVRSAIALAYGKPKERYSSTAEILGVHVDNVTMDHAVSELVSTHPTGKTRQVSFVNVDCINQAYHDDEYRSILTSSDLRLGDGIGLRLAGKLQNTEIRQNVNGTDLFPRLCECMARQGLSLFLLGGRPGVAEDVRRWIARNYPDLEVSGAQHGYFKPEEEPAILDQINASGAHVLLVAFGAPRQEKWIFRHKGSLAVRSAAGVGGLFDFYSGRIPRAPLWMREIGLEWTYRLYQEPRRMWKRYLVGNVTFLSRVVWASLRAKFAQTYPVTEGRAI